MRRGAPWVVGVVGAALVVVGLLVLVLAEEPPAEVFYTGSYEPLAELDRAYQSSLGLDLDGSVVWLRQELVGAGLAAAGALLLVGLAGWLLGRRSRR